MVARLQQYAEMHTTVCIRLHHIYTVVQHIARVHCGKGVGRAGTSPRRVGPKEEPRGHRVRYSIVCSVLARIAYDFRNLDLRSCICESRSKYHIAWTQRAFMCSRRATDVFES